MHFCRKTRHAEQGVDFKRRISFSLLKRMMYMSAFFIKETSPGAFTTFFSAWMLEREYPEPRDLEP